MQSRCDLLEGTCQPPQQIKISHLLLSSQAIHLLPTVRRTPKTIEMLRQHLRFLKLSGRLSPQPALGLFGLLGHSGDHKKQTGQGNQTDVQRRSSHCRFALVAAGQALPCTLPIPHASAALASLHAQLTL